MRRGVASQRRPGSSPSSSSSSSPFLSSSPALSSNSQPVHADGHIGPSSDPQMRTEFTSVPSPSVPPSSSMQHSNDEEDSQFMISSFGDSFTDATYVVRKLNKIINNCWMGQYSSWTTAPKEVKELWWNEFKRKFRWDEAEEKEVRRIFKKKAGDHMRNVMNRAKRSQEKPDFITADNWAKIKRTWDTEKHKQISEINKKNRASSSSKGSATYAGGSINIGEHRKRIVSLLNML
ncbi:uncharacterized protein LOC130135029 isoform X1 [Syzygium oleosum]|uniref:uncharacterized protein LOC130135029 isoform X1 n=1 Tax=Syzygium oleosum TaxID=219896 RepID=UPI0024BA7A0A|nr:uncharacterized protein LOC130135029 isoform X1 [Syzygium oleosum]